MPVASTPVGWESRGVLAGRAYADGSHNAQKSASRSCNTSRSRFCSCSAFNRRRDRCPMRIEDKSRAQASRLSRLRRIVDSLSPYVDGTRASGLPSNRDISRAILSRRTCERLQPHSLQIRFSAVRVSASMRTLRMSFFFIGPNPPCPRFFDSVFKIHRPAPNEASDVLHCPCDL